MLATLRRLFAWDDWANREALASLRSAGASPPSRALKFLAHIVACEQLWLSRLKQDGRKLMVWPELTLEECEARLAELQGLWRDYLKQSNAEKLSQSVSYVNSKGEPWASTVEDILLHVVMHSAYHRG
ncbi:MAG: DinB family protein [Terriglobia bacterium]